MGGTGEGPGEFRRIRLLGHVGGSRLAVWDDFSSRLTVFDSTGGVESTVRTWSGEEIQPRAFGLYSDGSVLIVEGRNLEAGLLTEGASWQDTLRLMRLDPTTGGRREQAQVPGTSWIWTDGNLYPMPFSINTRFVVVGEALHVVSGPDFKIRVYSNGSLIGVYGVERPQRPVTSAEIRAWSAAAAQSDPRDSARSQLMLNHPLLAGFLPGYSQIVSSSDGNVWARLYSDPLAEATFAEATWDVYSSAGEWRGQVKTPARFWVNAIDRDRLIGVWYDTLDVEYLRAYEIVLEPSGTG
jgi:hypothetical protein